MDRSSWLVVLNGGVTVVALVLTAVFGQFYMSGVKSDLVAIHELESQKTDILNRMSTLTRDRELGVFSLYFIQDAWTADTEYLEYHRLGAEFIQLRRRYEGLLISDGERIVFSQILALIRDLQPREEQVVEDIRGRQAVDLNRYMEQINIPAQSRIQGLFDQLIKEAGRQSIAAFARAERRYDSARVIASLAIVLATLLVTITTLLVMRRIAGYQAQLHDGKALAESAMQGVTDAVITTDATFYITDINPAAQMLFGYRHDDVVGRDVRQVMRLVTERDRRDIGEWKLIEQASGPYCLAHQDISLLAGDRLAGVEMAVSPVVSSSGRLSQVVYVLREVTRERQRMQRVVWRATHDPLTQTKNRDVLEQDLQRLLSRGEATERHALVMIDLDNFKPVNDTYGHAVGDALLIAICREIEKHIRHRDLLSRLGGDEFAILLEDCPDAKAEKLVRDIFAATQVCGVDYLGKKIACGGLSVGVVRFSARGQSWRDVLEQADRACYQAKREGKNRIVLSDC